MAGGKGVGAAGLEICDGLARTPLPLTMAKVDRQRAGSLVAGIGLFGQGLGEDAAERLRYPVVDVDGRPRLNAGMQLAPVRFVAPG
ncbi:hypothetical protein D3C80_1234190 [compost metagenome]